MRVLALLFALAGASSVLADTSASEGIENCYNKCNKVFDRNQYAIADQVSHIRMSFCQT